MLYEGENTRESSQSLIRQDSGRGNFPIGNDAGDFLNKPRKRKRAAGTFSHPIKCLHHMSQESIIQTTNSGTMNLNQFQNFKEIR